MILLIIIRSKNNGKEKKGYGGCILYITEAFRKIKSAGKNVEHLFFIIHNYTDIPEEDPNEAINFIKANALHFKIFDIIMISYKNCN